MKELNVGMIGFYVDDKNGGEAGFTVAQWPGFLLDGMLPSLRVNGEALTPVSCRAARQGLSAALRLEYAFPGGLGLCMHLDPWHDSGMRLRAEVRWEGAEEAVLNDVCLLGTGAGETMAAFGSAPESVRMLEQQGTYHAGIRRLAEPPADLPNTGRGEPNEAPVNTGGASDIVWVAYDQAARRGLLVGFLSSERWCGRIEMESNPAGQVLDWRVGFDGADLLIQPGAAIPLEEVLFLAGDDPWKLLEDYADAVRAIHNPAFPARPPVSWCSWYPYRLGVTEDCVIRNAHVAAERLKPLGLRIMEIDLGWEKDNLPNAFEENERFPHGLKWLSEQMQRLGLELGVWKAPYTISEFDTLVAEHPEYLVQDENGAPAPYWEWLWEPHGNVYILDLTHPGARQWLREKWPVWPIAEFATSRPTSLIAYRILSPKIVMTDASWPEAPRRRPVLAPRSSGSRCRTR
ncbi:MAG: alpha-galactosidase [Planctomycetes bacterium]|nr:alpha-galactosidase [Planctomycetota bacterium]